MKATARTFLALCALSLTAPALADELLTGELRASAPGHITIAGKTVPLLASSRDGKTAGTVCLAAGDTMDCAGLRDMAVVNKARVTLRGAHALKIEILEP